MDLLSGSELPEGFDYPPSMIRLSQTAIVLRDPWELLAGDRLRQRFHGLRERYPSRLLVPFAERIDCDDVACIDAAGEAVVVHDFASPGWEQRERFTTVDDWMRAAFADSDDYEQE